jgi:osmotically-inducible protein OsmY
MNISRAKRILIIGAYLGSAVCGLGGFASLADAQNAAAPPAQVSSSVAVAGMQGTTVLADQELGKRVKSALHSDPYLYDEHVTVSVEDGAVVLRGFVLSEVDLLDVLRVSRKAAGGRPVVDDLVIKLSTRAF